MARQGRDLERLVELLERYLGSDSRVTIKSPDSLVDKTTGGLREVDVSIRSRIGSTEILVILECRDRGSPQDVTWIEQLATKRDDVGANKAVAVSSSGFSEHAASKAKSKNIDLRTIDERSIADFATWFVPRGIVSHARHYDVKQAYIEFADDAHIEAAKNVIPTGSSCLFEVKRTADAVRYSLMKIIAAFDQNRLFEGVVPDAAPINRNVVIKVANNEFVVETPSGEVPVGQFFYELELKIVTTTIPFEFKHYTDDTKSLVQVVEAELPNVDGKSRVLNIMRGVEQGPTVFAVRNRED